jgi:hypothetical protein
VASQESSFDIVSKLDRQEADNALNQAAKEIGTRFDFRGVGASIAWSGEHAVDIRANSEERAMAVLDVFKDKLVKRGVSLKTTPRRAALDRAAAGRGPRRSRAWATRRRRRSPWGGWVANSRANPSGWNGLAIMR